MGVEVVGYVVCYVGWRGLADIVERRGRDAPDVHAPMIRAFLPM